MKTILYRILFIVGVICLQVLLAWGCKKILPESGMLTVWLVCTLPAISIAMWSVGMGLWD